MRLGYRYFNNAPFCVTAGFNEAEAHAPRIPRGLTAGPGVSAVLQ